MKIYDQIKQLVRDINVCFHRYVCWYDFNGKQRFKITQYGYYLLMHKKYDKFVKREIFKTLFKLRAQRLWARVKYTMGLNF